MATDLPPHLEIGKTYFVWGAKDNWIGRLVAIGPHSVTLVDASWVAQSGRLHQFVRDGKAPSMELEPVGVVCVQWPSWIPWEHPLPKEAV